MRPIIKFFAVIFFLTGTLSVYSQDNPTQFDKVIEYNEYREVFFTLDHRATELEYKSIYNAIVERDGVVSFVIDNGVFCKLAIKYDVLFDDIRTIIVQNGFTIKPETEPIKENKDMEIHYPTHFPVRKVSDNPALDEEIYQKGLQYWKSQYPDEYKAYIDEINGQSK